MNPSKEDLKRWRQLTLEKYDFDCEVLYVSETVRLPKAHIIALLDLIEEQQDKLTIAIEALEEINAWMEIYGYSLHFECEAGSRSAHLSDFAKEALEALKHIGELSGNSGTLGV